MAGRHGLQARIQAEIRKRKHHGRPQPVPTGNVRSDRWEEITRSHADVLAAIETTLVDSWRQIEGVDDHWVHQGLIGAMREQLPDHPTSWFVFRQLQTLREQLNEVPADLWLDALRVVAQSVRDHSSLEHSDRSYLAFVRLFLQRDNSG